MRAGHRLITLILICCGLRVGDATSLTGDCLVTDPQGGAYLRDVNHEMNREALVSVDDELRSLITAAHARLADRTTASVVLFPRPTSNPECASPGRRTRWGPRDTLDSELAGATSAQGSGVVCRGMTADGRLGAAAVSRFRAGESKPTGSPARSCPRPSLRPLGRLS